MAKMEASHLSSDMFKWNAEVLNWRILGDETSYRAIPDIGVYQMS